MDSTAKVVAGMSVTGTGIAAGTTVASVDSETVLTLSAATTATNANQTFTFAGHLGDDPPIIHENSSIAI